MVCSIECRISLASEKELFQKWSRGYGFHILETGHLLRESTGTESQTPSRNRDRM
jgi:hypothetical protein